MPLTCMWNIPANRYKVVKQLGDGTYGTVWKAINRQSNEVVSMGADYNPMRDCMTLERGRFHF